MDLAELQTLSGFLMNEMPDNAGHFYPPWGTDLDPIVKDDSIAPAMPMSRIQEEANFLRIGGVEASATEPKVDISTEMLTGAIPGKAGLPRFSPGATASTLRKTSAGGVTRRRSSSKEEQAKKRRERNRVLARRTRLRKKFFFQSLQQQVSMPSFST